MLGQSVSAVPSPSATKPGQELNHCELQGTWNPVYWALQPHVPPSPHLSKDRPDQRGQALGPRLPLDGLHSLQKQGHSEVNRAEASGCPGQVCSTLDPFLASLRNAEFEKHKAPSQHMQDQGLGDCTFWGPCRAVPLCSLLCGLGRMVGGNVQMGPCSPSSASPSLQRRVKN